MLREDYQKNHCKIYDITFRPLNSLWSSSGVSETSTNLSEPEIHSLNKRDVYKRQIYLVNAKMSNYFNGIFKTKRIRPRNFKKVFLNFVSCFVINLVSQKQQNSLHCQNFWG